MLIRRRCRLATRLVVLACTALAMAGCSSGASYRYKLTLSLDTPDGVKTGFNVVEQRFWHTSFPMSGTPHKTIGEGIYINLGDGRRPLVVLLTSRWRPGQKLGDWTGDDPAALFWRHCLGQQDVNLTLLDAVRLIARCTTPFALSSSELPDLVTFADVNDPRSVMKVDPADLSATLGPGLLWRSRTLQTTDEPLTSGVMEAKLPWLSRMTGAMHLDGGDVGYGPRGSVANSLQQMNFIRKD